MGVWGRGGLRSQSRMTRKVNCRNQGDFTNYSVVGVIDFMTMSAPIARVSFGGANQPREKGAEQ